MLAVVRVLLAPRRTAREVRQYREAFTFAADALMRHMEREHPGRRSRPDLRLVR